MLYLQVGISFMAGVAFAIVLIPINRWLAIKIGQLSTEMMHHKDARVKVSSRGQGQREGQGVKVMSSGYGKVKGLKVQDGRPSGKGG